MPSTPAVIWDVDGTLVDTAEHHFRAWTAFAAEVGKPFTRSDFAATFGLRNPDIIRRLFYPDATDETCDQLGERKESFYKDAVRKEGTELLPGVKELLDGFAAVGWLQAVGSSAPPGNIELLLGVTGTARYFAAVVTGDDVKNGKPHPEVFLTAAAKLGVEPARCVVFEDAVAGVRAAKAGGMTAPAEKLKSAGADVIVPTLTEVTPERVRSLLG
jgi:beta-phosphoglucomutase